MLGYQTTASSPETRSYNANNSYASAFLLSEAKLSITSATV